MADNKHFIVVHLLNDFSGSPRVLSQAVRALADAGARVEIHTSHHDGALSGIAGTTVKPFVYEWSPRKWLTLWRFVRVQLLLFGRMFFRLRKPDGVYVNTVLPAGAALGAWLRGIPVVYHIHETSVKPARLKALLFGIANRTARETVYVSHFLAMQEPLDRPRSRVIYNAPDPVFASQLIHHQPKTLPQSFEVLMPGSLKAYKGIYVLVELARALPELSFRLILNASAAEVEAFAREVQPPANLHLLPVQRDMVPWYRQAALVVNLSLPDQWVETFGMTVVEAACFGVPVVVPPVGGIAEIVTDGESGFHADARELEPLVALVQRIATDPVLYQHLSAGALRNAARFRPERFSEEIQRVWSSK